MPPSLAEGRITNDAISVRVVERWREVIYASPGLTDQPLAVRQSIDDGHMKGMTVEASIAPDVAPLLVFGGIPRPLPIYTFTLAVTGVLLLTALLQLRKERALARLRSDFVASVSHELRTPLTQIRMFAETLLLDRVRSDEERRRSLTVIDQETRRLAQLVENVLQFSRGERGTLRLTRESADVAALVAETVDAFLPIASARGTTIVTSIPVHAVAMVDRDAVRQIVLNLLDNAVKYGPAGQEIGVIVEKDASAFRIIVDDAGPGVPARDRARIWRRFERLERERERAIAGAGIGLALVRELAAMHGGGARVEDGTRGGARFIVEIPS
jgi:signal transduction histidine kinase